MKLGPIVAAVAMALPAGAMAQQPTADALAFLAGCWEQRSGETLIQEQWMAPAGGQTLGMARTVRSGRVVAYEQLLIEATPQGLDYVATPSGQARTRFALVRQGTNLLEFGNPAHDFPTTIRYTLLAVGELLAQIEGPSQDKTKVISLHYRRVACH